MQRPRHPAACVPVFGEPAAQHAVKDHLAVKPAAERLRELVASARDADRFYTRHTTLKLDKSDPIHGWREVQEVERSVARIPFRWECPREEAPRELAFDSVSGVIMPPSAIFASRIVANGRHDSPRSPRKLPALDSPRLSSSSIAPRMKHSPRSLESQGALSVRKPSSPRFWSPA